MTSLTDVYEGRVGRVASRRQQLLGTALFLSGGAMVVAAIGVATTGVGVETMGKYGGRELAGILAGLGLPAVLLGVFAVLPAAGTIRAGAGIGAGVAVLGVALFRHAYPYDWVSSSPLFALAAVAVYFLGVVTIFWCLFVALATFKTRNDPGGTARMEITREGTIRLVEEARSLGRFGGVGLFGSEPDGAVETQTNRETAASERATAGTPRDADVDPAPASSGGRSAAAPGSRRAATADGGSAATNGISEPNTGPSASDVWGDATSRDAGGAPDVYCGNCRHFEYVMEDGEPVPYCSLHEFQMEDMEACSGWVKQSPGDDPVRD